MTDGQAGSSTGAAADGQHVPRDVVQRELAELLSDGLTYVAGALTILALIYGVAHRYVLEPPVPASVAAGFLAAAGLYAAVGLARVRWEMPSSWAYPIAMGFAVVIVVNLVSVGLVRQEPWVSTDFMLFFIAQGLVVLDRRWLVPMATLTLAGWGLVFWVSPPDPMWTRFGYWLFSSVFIAGVLNVVRRRSVVRALTTRYALERQNEELARVRDEAQAAERAKTALLANTSHEVRTPMNAIIGMTSLLEQEGLPDQAREYVETIRTSSEHLLIVINDILDLSRLEADRMEIEAFPFRLRDCLKEAVGIVASRAREKGLELTLDIDDDVPEGVVSDPNRLRQILVNLLSNAVKFTPEGEVAIHVRRASDAEGQDQLAFSVKDTGIGIPEDKQASLFQPFTQVDPTTTRRYGGTGLGLSIARGLVELMDGRIWVESTPREGSTFTFTIHAPGAEIPEEIPRTIQPEDIKGLHVLIVDDNETNRRLLERQTSAWGMIPISVPDAGQALSMLDGTTNFDLALLDYEMPRTTGAELARRIRERIPSQQLPIVMLSSGTEGRRSVEEEGVQLDGFITKPVRPSTLYELVLRLVAARAQPHRPRPAPEIDQTLGTENPLRILIAEDNEINRRVLERMLEHLGYEPDAVSNGKDAVDRVAEQPFDVVFMDVQMPYLDGVEATHRIKADPPAAGTPRIVALTAHATDDDRERLLAAGMDDYIPKPVDLETLAHVLAKVKPLAARADADDAAEEPVETDDGSEPDAG